MIRATWQERLFASADETPGGCWTWRGPSGFNGNGYALFHGPANIPGQPSYTTAHRWAWIAANGQVPAGLHIDHLCNVTLCINPAHLEAVTHAENQRRRAERMTHCLKGHEWTEENTYRRGRGWRECRTCKRARKATFMARRQVSA